MSSLFPHLTPGQPYIFHVVHGGRTLACEAVLADTWAPGLAAAPSPGADLRLVLLSRWQRVPRRAIPSPRVAVIVPEAPTTPGPGRVRETPAAYAPAASARESPERAAYAAGKILTRGALALTCAEAFADGDTQRALERIAGALAEQLPLSGWEAATPYLRALAPDMAQASAEEARRRLPEALASIAQRVQAARGALRRLARGLGQPVPTPVGEALARLGGLARDRSNDGFARRVQALHASVTPDRLAGDIALAERVERAGAFAEEAAAVRRYLAEADHGRDEDMGMDRLSILEQLTVDNLVAHPHVWPSLRSRFEWFQARYRGAYQRRHRAYRQQMADLKRRLDGAERKVEALARLNTLRELGAPLDKEALKAYADLRRQAQPCAHAEADLDINSGPVCTACGVTLLSEPPQAQVQAVLGQIEDALAAQNRRLSSRAIRRILARGKGQRLEQFLQVVQASDAGALAEVLDDDLVAFLRRLLREAEVAVPGRAVLNRLAQEFPTVDEAQLPDVLSAFADILWQALQDAQKQHPSKKVRISLREH